jgi:hypothetical protein
MRFHRPGAHLTTYRVCFPAHQGAERATFLDRQGSTIANRREVLDFIGVGRYLGRRCNRTTFPELGKRVLAMGEEPYELLTYGLSPYNVRVQA